MIITAREFNRRAGRARARLRRDVSALIAACAVFLTTVQSQAAATNYAVRGVLKAVKPDERQLVIAHDPIRGFMEAMTMPFNVKDAALLTNAAVGAKITFQLHVTEDESWIDNIKAIGAAPATTSQTATVSKTVSAPPGETNTTTPSRAKNPLRDFPFTNELGQPVRLSDFDGQAIALTFIFTRCPIPEYCPRLSRNFQEVQRKLKSMDSAPTNWRLLTVSFDPERDTPQVLKQYGESYQYDPKHWTFLTGPKDKLTELARLCEVKFEADNGSFDHNFRTLIIDASNNLQMVFPTSGDLADAIAQELLKATGANRGTNSESVKSEANR